MRDGRGEGEGESGTARELGAMGAALSSRQEREQPEEDEWSLASRFSSPSVSSPVAREASLPSSEALPSSAASSPSRLGFRRWSWHARYASRANAAGSFDRAAAAPEQQAHTQGARSASASLPSSASMFSSASSGSSSSSRRRRKPRRSLFSLRLVARHFNMIPGSSSEEDEPDPLVPGNDSFPRSAGRHELVLLQYPPPLPYDPCDKVRSDDPRIPFPLQVGSPGHQFHAPTLQELCLFAICREDPELTKVPLHLMPVLVVRVLLNLLLSSERATPEALVKIAAASPLAFETLRVRMCNRPNMSWLRAVPSLSETLKELDLRGLVSLSDEALPILASARSLRVLNLSSCIGLTSFALRDLALLEELEELYLENIPELDDSVLEHLSALPRLKRLSLSGCNRVSDAGVKFLKRCSSLTHLSLTQCFCVTDKSLKLLLESCGPQFEVLKLTSTRATQEIGGVLQTCTNLRELHLGGIVLERDEACEWLGSLTRLESLFLDRTGVGDQVLATIDSLFNLRELSVAYTSVSDRGVINHVSRLQALEVLDLEYTYVTDNAVECGLRKLVNLKKLNLAETSVTDAGLSGLLPLHRLEELDLSGSGISGTSCPNLSRLVHLRHLSVDASNVNFVSRLSALTELESLDLFSCKVADSVVPALRKLTKLKRLEICGGRLTNHGLMMMAGLHSLEYLNVANNQGVSNSGVASLHENRNLRNLNLAGTSVSDAVVPALERFPALETLCIRGCDKLSGAARQRLSRNERFVIVGEKIMESEI
ncbi:putative adenylate cyclase regulatory protein [Porphyridium purpureum]|uniref:Putative adenylate cyclase regulatory protein n=1 Tax=Porphyridium purpureum TaxID=35688 RepID=A0A5J4YLM9_PORPP|nr:putative adenylate cyclase regulatory protein [Porphyridium purpureum]|eukprot:POR3001..scf249_10